MAKRPLKLLIVIVVTFAAAGLVHMVNTMEPIKNNRFMQFPLSINDWQGTQVTMSDWVYQGLESPYVFLRNYSSQKENLRVNLSLLWFDDTNYAFHAPEACMSSIMRERHIDTIDIKTLGRNEVVKMIVEIDGQRNLLLYFFDVDGYITTSQAKIRMRSLVQRLQFKRTSATFVRVMAPIEVSQEETMKVLTRFLDEMYPLIPEYTYTDKILAR